MELERMRKERKEGKKSEPVSASDGLKTKRVCVFTFEKTNRHQERKQWCIKPQDSTKISKQKLRRHQGSACDQKYKFQQFQLNTKSKQKGVTKSESTADYRSDHLYKF